MLTGPRRVGMALTNPTAILAEGAFHRLGILAKTATKQVVQLASGGFRPVFDLGHVAIPLSKYGLVG